MRIGIDARLWSETGVGRYIRNLVINLQEIDEKNEYVLFVKRSDIKKIRNVDSDIQIKDNWKLVITDIRWHTIKEQIKLPAVLKNEHPDLVHFPYFSAPILYNQPFVVTIHDLILHNFPTGEASTLSPFVYQMKMLGYRFVIGQAARKAEKVLTVSQATKEEIIDHLHIPEESVVVTYEGIDSHLTDSDPKKVIGDQYFLHVGNVYPHKNMDRLIDAFTLAFKNSPMKLVVVGREDYFAKRLKEYVRKKQIEENVMFAGEVSDIELNSLYHHATSLVIPSLMEGFSLPAVEAMANNCLVLISDIPVHREVCADAAIYFDPFDIEGLKYKLHQVCFNDLNHFSRKKEVGRERSRMFSWEKMAKETLAVYENCLSASLRP